MYIFCIIFLQNFKKDTRNSLKGTLLVKVKINYTLKKGLGKDYGKLMKNYEFIMIIKRKHQEFISTTEAAFRANSFTLKTGD